ncbi:MAG: hypothetical protein ISS45_05295 [Candidatus Omnitrophica bacterium]|nr:hypothetical protein [Candidatus Omnitrophota bacterium]
MVGKIKKKTAKRRIVKKRVVKKRSIKKRVVKKRLIKKRVVKRRIAKKRPTKKRVPKSPVKKTKENIIGVVSHYFPRVRAAAIKLKAPLRLGDSIRIKGHTTDFIQVVNSLQIDRQVIAASKRGQEVGILVDSRVRGRDIVYRI